MHPTVGRVVWFRPNGAMMPGHLKFDPEQPAKADVVFVHSDTMVNLLVVDHNGTTHPMSSLPLRDPDDAPMAPGQPYCEWMPYQLGQAAKTEDLSPRVKALEEKVAAIDTRTVGLTQIGSGG